MIRRVVLAFLAFGLVACGDDGIGPEDIVSTYTSDTQNGEEFGYSLAPPISLDSRLAKTAGPERKGRDGPEAEGEQGDRRS